MKDLKRRSFNYTSQFVTGNEVKVPIYPQFRAARIRRKHLKTADMIDLNDSTFCRHTLMLVQRADVPSKNFYARCPMKCQSYLNKPETFQAKSTLAKNGSKHEKTNKQKQTNITF